MKYAPLIIALAIFALDLFQGISSLSPRLTVKPALVLYLWILGLAIVIGSVFFSAVAVFRKASFWTLQNLLAVLSVVVIIGFAGATPLSELTTPSTMHPEAARQASCGIGKLLKNNGFGEAAYSWCFLGYNTRQYIPQAFLWRFFGPSTFNLNVVYIFFLVLGFIAYAVGLRKAQERGYGGHILLLTALLMPLQSTYYYFLTSAYEQSIFPLCLTLLTLGILLQCAFDFTAWNVGIALLSIQYLLFSYTPALSVYFFAAGLLALLALNSLSTTKSKLWAFAAISVYSVAHFALSLGHRADIKLAKTISTSTTPDTQSTFAALLKAIVYLPWGAKSVHSSAFSIASVLVAFFLILAVKNSRARIVAICALGWSIAHLLLAAYAKGYAAPPIPFSLHRALPIFPVFGALIFFGFGALRNKGPKYLFPGACLLVFALHLSLAISQGQSYAPDREVRRKAAFPHAEILDHIYSRLADKNIKHLVVGSFFDSAQPRKTFPDFASYYFPEARWARGQLPTIPPWFQPTDNFVGLLVGGASEIEPIVSGAQSLPEGITIEQEIRVPQVTNSDEPVIALVYTRQVPSEGAGTH